MAEDQDAAHRKLIDRVVPMDEWGPLQGVFATTYEMQPEFVETDLLPSVFGLGAWDDRSWTTRVALERRLAETEVVTVLTEASRYRGRPRSMRVRIVPVDLKTGGVLHAKIVVLLYTRAVRLLVGSANLTDPGYRRNREGVVVLTATERSVGDAALITSGITDIQEMFGPWLEDATKGMLGVALGRVRTWSSVVPSLKETFAWSGGGRRLWEQFLGEWPAGDLIRSVTIASPFWSEDTGRSLGAFLEAIHQRRLASPNFRVKLLCEAFVDPTGRVAPVLPASFASTDWHAYGVTVSAQAVDPSVLPEEVGGMEAFTGTRSLHAKVVFLEGERTAQVYIGSANFTSRGWGFAANVDMMNVEAGIILRRAAVNEGLLSLLPPTTGEPVVLNGAASGMLAQPDAKSTLAPWPAFIRSIELSPHLEGEDRLDLVVQVDPGARGTFGMDIPAKDGSERIPLLAVTDMANAGQCLRVDLPPAVLNRLLVDQEVHVAWEAFPEGRMVPVNVDANARLRLPIAPGQGRIAESQLVSYYQGRIAWEALFPDPEGEDDDHEHRPSLQSEMLVDKSRIQSYQIREFVEALEGIKQELRAAAQSEATMRLALLGAVSPVALARSVMDAVNAGSRTPVAAAFQLVELLCCLDEAGGASVKPQPSGTWQTCVSQARTVILGHLDGLSQLHPDLSNPRLAFSRYRREVGKAGGE